jgi:predicted ATPase
MVQVLSEYFSDNLKEKATVQQKGHLFEVLWEGKSVGTYSTEQEAENVAENYALGSQISRT